MIDGRRAAWRPVTESELRALAASGVVWSEFAAQRGIPRTMLMATVSVLGISNRTEPARVRVAILAAMAGGGKHTVAMLHEAAGGSLDCVKHAIQALLDAALIRSTVRKVEVDNPRKAWAQYVITQAGLKQLAQSAPRKQA